MSDMDNNPTEESTPDPMGMPFAPDAFDIPDAAGMPCPRSVGRPVAHKPVAGRPTAGSSGVPWVGGMPGPPAAGSLQAEGKPGRHTREW